MPDTIMSMDSISDELKTLPATQYDIAMVRNALHEIQNHLQKIYNAIEINKTAQSGICSVHGTRTTNLETKMVDIEKRVSDVEDVTGLPHEVDKIKTRLDTIEKYMYMAMGVIAFLQIVIPIAIKVFWK